MEALVHIAQSCLAQAYVLNNLSIVEAIETDIKLEKRISDDMFDVMFGKS